MSITSNGRHSAPSAGFWSRKSKAGKVAIITLALMVLAGIALALILINAKAHVTGTLSTAEQTMALEFADAAPDMPDACNDEGSELDPIGVPASITASPTRSTENLASCDWVPTAEGLLTINGAYEGYAPTVRTAVKNVGDVPVAIQSIHVVGDSKALGEVKFANAADCPLPPKVIAPGEKEIVSFGFSTGVVPATPEGTPDTLDFDIEIVPVSPTDYSQATCLAHNWHG